MNTAIRAEIHGLVAAISPTDSLEAQHRQETLNWIEQGDPIFRIAKPDIPPRHLVSYFVVFDPTSAKVLLADHKKAQLWLPTGGHVEYNEHPRDTVTRECFEELGMIANFLWDLPIFLTSTLTVGLTAGHIDVSLWYVLKSDSSKTVSFDKEEFENVRWFKLDEIPFDQSDPHMQRFVRKLRQIL